MVVSCRESIRKRIITLTLQDSKAIHTFNCKHIVTWQRNTKKHITRCHKHMSSVISFISKLTMLLVFSLAKKSFLTSNEGNPKSNQNPWNTSTPLKFNIYIPPSIMAFGRRSFPMGELLTYCLRCPNTRSPFGRHWRSCHFAASDRTSSNGWSGWLTGIPQNPY